MLLLFFLLMLVSADAYAQPSWERQKAGEYAQAMQEADREMSTTRSFHDTVYASALENGGMIYYLNGELETSARIRDEVLALRAKHYSKKNNRSYVRYMNALNNVALVNFYLGNYEKTDQVIRTMQSMEMRYPVTRGAAQYEDYFPYTELANVLHFRGNLEQAEAVHLKGVDFYRKKILPATFSFELSDKMKNSEKYACLERYYYAVINAATFYQNAGLYYKEEALLKNLEEVALQKLDADTDYQKFWINSLSPFYAFMGRYDRAQEILARVDKDFTPKGRETAPQYASVANNYGIISWFKNDFASAHKHFLKARRLSLQDKRADYTAKNVIIPTNLSYTFFRTGDVKAAIKLQRSTLNRYEQDNKRAGKHIFNHGWYQTMMMQLGVFYHHTRQYDSAEYLLATAIRHNIIRNTQRTGMARKLAALYDDTHKTDQALTYYMLAFQLHFNFMEQNLFYFSEQERSDLYKDVTITKRDFDSFVARNISADPSLAGSLFNTQLITKGILFSSSRRVLSNVMASRDTAVANQYQRWKYARDFLAKVYQMDEAEKKKRNIDQRKLEQHVNLLEKNIAQRSKQFDVVTSQPTWQQVQEKLSADEAAVELVRADLSGDVRDGEPQYLALIITKKMAAPKVVVLEEGRKLEERYFKYYRNCIEAQISDTLSYKVYWKKIHEQLTGIKRVYLSADGIYNKISIRTLLNTRTGKYVLEEQEVQLVGTTRDLITKDARPTKPREIVLYGYPDYSRTTESQPVTQGAIQDSVRAFLKGSSITDLPGTKDEVQRIQDLLTAKKINAVSYLGDRATEENVKAGKSPQVLHIATHGFFLSDTEVPEDNTFAGYQPLALRNNPLLRSGVLLAGAQQSVNGSIDFRHEDGILTAHEAMNLNLTQTELVVLSACETGLGEVRNGEGVYGLQRAFQAAGSQSVIMSLWKVDDQATQELMTTFYDNWIKLGNKREAFNKAQIQLKVRYPQPKFWGAFVYNGF